MKRMIGEVPSGSVIASAGDSFAGLIFYILMMLILTAILVVYAILQASDTQELPNETEQHSKIIEDAEKYRCDVCRQIYYKTSRAEHHQKQTGHTVNTVKTK